MKTYKIIAIIDFAVSVAAFIIGLIVLPDNVPIQFSIGGSLTTAPKLLALAIPTLFGVITSPICFFSKENAERKKLYVLMAVGIILFPAMFISSKLIREVL